MTGATRGIGRGVVEALVREGAQVLLVAASKKGSPEARHVLEQMAEEGCTE